MAAILALPLFAGATLYSTVGHGGASAYLAIMALAGVEPSIMRPAALALNVLVAGVATLLFARAGRFAPRLFWPLALASVMAAFAGGTIVLSADVYRRVLGALLVVAAVPLVRHVASDRPRRTASLPLVLFAGACIGFVAGLTGIGGGVFLTPLLVLGGYCDTREASAVSAPFIVVNSAAGLLARPAALLHLGPAMPLWAAAALLGGLIGSHLGSSRLTPLTLRRLLAAVLLVAAFKLFLPT